MIRWGADASSDMLRRSARCTRCGRKGATIQLPGWGALQTLCRRGPGALGNAGRGRDAYAALLHRNPPTHVAKEGLSVCQGPALPAMERRPQTRLETAVSSKRSRANQAHDSGRRLLKEE